MRNVTTSSDRQSEGSAQSGPQAVALAAVVVALLAVLLGTSVLVAEKNILIQAITVDGDPDAGVQAAGMAIEKQLHNDGVVDPEWGEPIDDLQFRLRAERTTWLSWQQPIVQLDVRNVGEKTISAAALRQRVPIDQRHGLQLMRKPSDALPESEHYQLGMQIRFDSDDFQRLKPEEVLTVPIAIASTALSYDAGLFASDVLFGLGQKRPGVEPAFVSNLLPIRILPPGAATTQELSKLLNPYTADGRRIDAGFIPTATTVVDGERLEMTFLVRNSGDAMFGYSWGGDYRGTNRHDRFKIGIRDAAGEPLPDPRGQFGNMGGMLWSRPVEPGQFSAERIDLSSYRTIPGPGQYSVSAQFVLNNDFGQFGGPFEVPVETKFELTILPRTPARVTAVLDRLQARCQRTSHKPLDDTIEVLCEFGQQAAVPRLAQLARNGTVDQRRAAVRGLGTVPETAAMVELLKIEPDPEVREAALLALGTFSHHQAVARVVKASADPDSAVRQAAAAALGQLKTEAATQALLKQFEKAASLDEASAILMALGATSADKPFIVVSDSLGPKNDVTIRRAAVAAVQRFSRSVAAAALRPYAEDDDLDFRELVVRTLAEKLKARFQPELLVPVIRSRKGTNTIGDAPRLLRLYSDDKAAPTIISCLDFDDPEIRHYYNMTVITGQLSCRTGLAIPWIGDLNRDATREELQKNRQTLASLKEWVDEYLRQPWRELPEPWRLGQGAEVASWGPVINHVRLRARLNTSVWPQNLPQVISIDATNDGGSIVFNELPEVVEIEVDDEWYAHDPDIQPVVSGDWHAYKGQRWHSYQLTPHWQRVSDGRPLELQPGQHTARIRVSPEQGKGRSQLVTSLPVQFRIIGSNLKDD